MKQQKFTNNQFTMIQFVADHSIQSVNAIQIGTDADIIFTLGVAFENDPKIYELIKKALLIYSEYKNQ